MWNKFLLMINTGQFYRKADVISIKSQSSLKSIFILIRIFPESDNEKAIV